MAGTSKERWQAQFKNSFVMEGWLPEAVKGDD
jgi:hypothetical protein